MFGLSSPAAGARTLLTASLVWLALALGGCAGTPVSETQQDINTFTLAQAKMTDGRQQVADTLGSIHEFCARPGPATYNAFVRYAPATESTGVVLHDIFAVMIDQGDAFFLSWDHDLSEMTWADLKSRSAAQRQSAQAAFGQIDRQAAAVRAGYEKFVEDLSNLRAFFDFDKSAAGVTAASRLITTADADGNALEQQLDVQSANLDRMKAILVAMRRG